MVGKAPSSRRPQNTRERTYQRETLELFVLDCNVTLSHHLIDTRR